VSVRGPAHRRSFIATTHYLQSLVILILIVTLAWSFSWYFGVSKSYYHQQQPDMIQTVVPPMSLVPDVYIYSLYEPPEAAHESLITHHFDASTNYYCGFTYLSSRLIICLYTKVDNGQGTSSTTCVLNPWVVFISYWVSLLVCLFALSLVRNRCHTLIIAARGTHPHLS
jgi:hypothetical protein